MPFGCRVTNNPKSFSEIRSDECRQLRPVSKSSLRNSFLPVVGLTMAVHYRNDKNVIWFDSVENGVRKYAGKTPAHILFQDFPLFWFFGNMKNRLLD